MMRLAGVCCMLAFLISTSESQLGNKSLKFKICQKQFSDDRFTITLPKRERVEQSECTFTISAYAPDICRLKLNFKQFYINDLQPCTSQYLRVAGKRLCGSIFGNQFYQFIDNSTVIEYSGDQSHPLEIEVEQIRCNNKASSKSCDVTSSSLSTEITSPNYPFSYVTPLSCLYQISINPTQICQVVIRFLEFEVPESQDCIKGRLLVDGTSFCGRKTGLVVYKNVTGNFRFDFTEGSGQSHGYFRLAVDQVPCQIEGKEAALISANQYQPFPPIYPLLCCNRLYSSPHFILTSPGLLDLNEPSDYTCVYQITQATPQKCRLRITFLHFWLGYEDMYYGCTDGFLEIDGRRYCGCKEGLSFVSFFQNGRKEFVLNMRGSGRKGFFLEVQQEECGGFAGQKQPESVTISPESEVEVFLTNSTAEKVRSRFLIPNDDCRCNKWGHTDWLSKFKAIIGAIPDHCPAPPSNPLFPPVNPIIPPPILPPPVLPPWPPYPPTPPLIPPPIYPLPPIYPTPRPPIVPPIFPPPVVPPPPLRPPIIPPIYPSPPIYPTQNPPIAPPVFPPPLIRPPIIPPIYPSPPIYPTPRPPIIPPIFPPPPVKPCCGGDNIGPPIILPPNPPPPLRPPIIPPIYPSPPIYPTPRPPIVPPIFPPPPLKPCCDGNNIGPPIILPPNPPPPVFPPIPPLFPEGNCQVYNSFHGGFISPGYPWKYPGDLKCCYRIRQAPGFCKLKLIVLDFDVAWSHKCSKDYILLDHRARYCGHSLQSTASYINFRNGWAHIDFVTDSFFAGRGFRAEYQQIPCYSNSLPRTDDGNIEAIPNDVVTPRPDFELNVTPV